MNKEEHAKVLAALEALYLEMEVTPSNVHVMQDAEQCIAIMRKEPEPRTCPNGDKCEYGNWCTEVYCQSLTTFRDQHKPEIDPIFYMRDNHTFTKLSDDVEKALWQIGQDFDKGWTCGMLCSKRPGWTHIHANGNAERESFLKQCRARLEKK